MTAVASAVRTIRCNQTLDGKPCPVVVSGDTPADRLAKMGAHVAAAHGKAPRDAIAEASKAEAELARAVAPEGGARVKTKANKARSREWKERCSECGRKASSVPMSPSQHRKDCSRHTGAKSRTPSKGRGGARGGAGRTKGAKRGYLVRRDDGASPTSRALDVAAEIKRLKGVIADAQGQLDAIRAALDEPQHPFPRGLANPANPEPKRKTKK